MKKRRIAIVAFLLCATLVMGIGFAAVVDTLSITGRASYRPSSYIHSNVATAIHFDATFTPAVELDEQNDNIYPMVNATLTEEALPNSGDFSITINGTAGKMDYKALAVYKIVYEATDSNLPDVNGIDVSATLLDGQTAYDWFTTACKVVATNNVTIANFDQATPITTMAPGSEAYAYVLINAHFDDASEVPTTVIAPNLSVSLHFSVPDSNSVTE